MAHENIQTQKKIFAKDIIAKLAEIKNTTAQVRLDVNQIKDVIEKFHNVSELTNVLNVMAVEEQIGKKLKIEQEKRTKLGQ
jgi:hypothetical protein